MSTPPGTTRKKTEPARSDEEIPDIPTEGERLVRERVKEFQKEIDALRRENAELRRAERILQESEAKAHAQLAEIEAAYTSAPIGLCLLGTDTRYQHVNRQFAEMDRFSIEEHLGKTVRELVPDLAEAAEELVRTIVETGKPVLNIESRGETPAEPGVLRYWRESWWPVTDTHGHIIAISIVAEEITEQKRAEEALRRSREDLDHAQTVGQIGSWRLDIDRNVLTWSDENYRIFGVPGGTPLTYETFLGIVHPDDREYVDTRWKAGLCGEPYDIEHRILVDGRVKWVREKAYLEFDDAGGLLGGFGITQDITERKRAEEAFRRHTDELARLNRDLTCAHREANLYLDILTHDIGNTENVSNLYADLLIESLQGRGDEVGYAKKLQRSVQKSIEILRTVATIRRIHWAPSRLKPVDLDAAIRGMIGSESRSTLRYEGAHHMVLTDDYLSVVFDNLIGNAVKHGGPDVEVAVRVEEEDGFVRVSVEDTGPGVPDAEKDAIFHRYEQQKRGVGEGLGLYLVQILVERYGGTIWVDDRVPGHQEEGAAFRFTLQRAADGNPERRAA